MFHLIEIGYVLIGRMWIFNPWIFFCVNCIGFYWQGSIFWSFDCISTSLLWPSVIDAYGLSMLFITYVVEIEFLKCMMVFVLFKFTIVCW